MKSLLKYKNEILLGVFTLYSINHYIFERVFFFNELLSLAGFVIAISYFNNDKKREIILESPVSKLVIGFLALCFCYAFASIFIKTNWYYYLRNLSLIYSVFSFFVGYHLYTAQYGFFKKIRIPIYLFSLFALFSGIPNLIDRNAFATWLALLQKNLSLSAILIFVSLCLVYTYSYTSLTVVMIMAIVLFVSLVPSYQIFKRSIVIGLLLIVLIFVETSSYLSLHHQGNYTLFGEILNVYGQSSFFNIDHNSSWRLLFWFRLLVEDFPQNLVGIGIGTPMLGYLPGATTQELGHPDEYISHVIGAHNTFITFFYRFGILCLVFFALLYRIILKEFYQYKTHYLKHKNDLSLFLGFITITTVGIFNLLLETPTLASVYWVVLGFVGKAIENRKNEQDELQNM